MFILSTLTNGCTYNFYEQLTQDQINSAPKDRLGAPLLPLPRIIKRVKIPGGAGLASADSGFGERSEDLEKRPLWTPSGVVVEIPDADVEALKNHHVFREHMELGYVKFIEKDIRQNHGAIKKAVAADMEAKDRFAQLTPKDWQDGKVKVHVGEFDPTVKGR